MGHRSFFCFAFCNRIPQILALIFLDVPAWIAVQTVFLYTLGFVGVVRWIRKLNLSLTASAFVVILYTFNGFFSGKVGIGALPDMGGYFLVPWVLWLWNRFIEEVDAGMRQKLLLSLQFSFLLLFVLMRGSPHPLQAIILGGFLLVLLSPRQIPGTC